MPLDHLRTHPLGLALSVALGILIAAATSLLLFGLFTIFSTYLFLLAMSLLLTEALWRPKTATVRVLRSLADADVVVAPRNAIRGFIDDFPRHSWGVFALPVAAAAMATSLAPHAVLCLVGLATFCLTLIYALDSRVQCIFRLHRLVFTDDGFIALCFVTALVVVCTLSAAWMFVNVGMESVNLVQFIHERFGQMPEVLLAKSNFTAAVVERLNKVAANFNGTVWHPLFIAAESVLEGCGVSSGIREIIGNQTVWEALRHYAEKLYEELVSRDVLPTDTWDIVAYMTGSAKVAHLGVVSVISIPLSLVLYFVDYISRFLFFVSLLCHFLGRRESLLHLMLRHGVEGEAPETELEAAVRDILQGVITFPVARLYTRFLSTFLLARIFKVCFGYLLATATVFMSFGPLGSYPYLAAIPWVCTGAFGEFLSMPMLLFVTLLVGVHHGLDSIELHHFSVSHVVHPFAIGLSMVLGLEHFGAWALCYAPFMLCVATLAYRIFVKGEFLDANVEALQVLRRGL